MRRPTMFLDIDGGGLNPVKLPPPVEITFECLGYTILRCPACKDERFKELDQVFDIAQTTTWVQNAKKFIAPHFGIHNNGAL